MVLFTDDVVLLNVTVLDLHGTKYLVHYRLYLVRSPIICSYQFRKNWNVFNRLNFIQFNFSVTVDDKLWGLDSSGVVHQLLTSSPLKNGCTKNHDEILHLDEDWVLL